MSRFKKLISAILVVTLIFITAFLNTGIMSSAEQITTAYINGDHINVRNSPSVTATRIDQIEYVTVDVISIETTSDNNYKEWLHISYNKGGTQKTGYIYYDKSYITVTTHTYNPDASFEERLEAFPQSYRDALRKLHAVYPNWEFIADYVDMTFDEAVALESENMRKQVHETSQPISWRSMGYGSYDWNKNLWVFSNDRWTGASREIIAYYMDPRNFLDSTYIYTFLQQRYDSAKHTEDGVKKIISGTFMENGYSDPNDTAYGGSYVKVIMAAANATNVSPYILASKIRHEIGVNESSMVSGNYPGYEGLYNFFNVGASGQDGTVIQNGLATARENGWTTRSAAIIGGAQFLGNKYINAGQGTYYYQDFNVKNPNQIWHQFAQAIHDAASKGRNLAEIYLNEYNMALDFYIPVYSTMPLEASQKPVENTLRNNYYFNEISVSGLTPSFSRFNYNYDLKINGDTAVKITLPKGATLASPNKYNLSAGISKVVLTVKSETGYTNDYVISVNSTSACSLYITYDGVIPDSSEGGTTIQPESPPTPSVPTVTIGDTNLDGNINIFDLARVQMHILSKKPLTGNALIAADVNKDGKVDIFDLARVQMHILGKKMIEQ